MGIASPRALSVHIPSNGLTELEPLTILYGNMYRTIMTLFLGISGGNDWAELAEPLAQISWVYVVLWIFYIVFMLFGVLNILTGVFVDLAMQAAQQDRDIAIQTQSEETDSYIDQIREVFEASDTDGS